MVRLNLFDLFAKISLDTSDYDSGVKNAKKSASQLKSDVMKLAQTYKAQGMSMSDAMKKAYSEIDKSQYETADTSQKTSDQFSKNWDKTEKSISSLASTLKKGLASAGKAAAVGIGAITTAAGAAVGGLLALEQSTEEYRIAQGKLKTAFDAAGMSADAAQEAYKGFYEILGDTDTATEASQLLAKLAESEEDVSKWTEIAAGVNGTFGDSLPIEGLIESANETAKVGLG